MNKFLLATMMLSSTAAFDGGRVHAGLAPAIASNLRLSSEDLAFCASPDVCSGTRQLLSG